MKFLLAGMAVLTANAARAHESFVPHVHPHGVSWLPDADLFGPVALVLAVAIIAYTRFHRG